MIADDAPQLCITPFCRGEPELHRAGVLVWLTCPICKARWQEEDEETNDAYRRPRGHDRDRRPAQRMH
jgi:hypothetical protein